MLQRGTILRFSVNEWGEAKDSKEGDTVYIKDPTVNPPVILACGITEISKDKLSICVIGRADKDVKNESM